MKINSGKVASVGLGLVVAGVVVMAAQTCPLIEEDHKLRHTSEKNEKIASRTCPSGAVTGPVVYRALINIRNEQPNSGTSKFVSDAEFIILKTDNNPVGLTFCFDNAQADRTVKYDNKTQSVVFGPFTDTATQLGAVETAVRAVYHHKTPQF